MVEAVWVADTQLQLSQLSCLDADLHKDQRRQSFSSSEALVDTADSKGQARLGSQLGSQAQPVEISYSDESSDSESDKPRRSGRVRRSTRAMES
jgi:hypothetical protein